MKSLLCVTLAPPVGAHNADWGHLLDALAMVESGDVVSSVGDAGQSRGAWQMSAAAWADVNQVRRRAGRRTAKWKWAAHDPKLSREYASDFLALIHGRLAEKLGRPPTVQELYAVWNLGEAGFARCQFLFARCPQKTQDAAKRLFDLLAKEHQSK